MGLHSTAAHRALITALHAKDPNATATLYDHHAPALHAYACGFVEASEASDIVHDAVWIASGRIAALREASLFEAWLHAIVRSESLRVLQQARKPSEYRPAIDEAAYPDTASQEPEALDAVRAAVTDLHSTHREAFDLAARHRFTAPEVDAVLGTAVGAGGVLSDAHDALARALPWLSYTAGTDPAETGTTRLFARLPMPPLPARLRDRVLVARPSGSELAAMGRRIDPVDREGFPSVGRPRRTAAVAAATGGVAVLVALTLLVWPDRAPAEQPAPKPLGGSGQLGFGSALTAPPGTGTPTPAATTTDSEAAVSETTAAGSTAVTTTVAPTTTDGTTASRTTSETASASTPPATGTSTTETRWSSRRDSRSGAGNDESGNDRTEITTSYSERPPSTTTSTAEPVPKFPGPPFGGR
ncbi:RNA polymerase sigma factor [Rhodococcus chondri]|uniref:Sigma-70 family RNA polymerase sigma factor n=1 Tax=Rhodococcus chondri TaxID=3065941 RepID=A0ABU7JV98_9NOCA|nr:sigma-70 family RNA polymerase sigma factor [Rhodococcus sp. CC-R104]MEE2033953.1 sigma-70 family RNA polymerase sigma factor [Rhodococcus sp. CC-R104]